MSKFHISQTGKERLRSWHKANVNRIANDPIIKEKYRITRIIATIF